MLGIEFDSCSDVDGLDIQVKCIRNNTERFYSDINMIRPYIVVFWMSISLVFSLQQLIGQKINFMRVS